MKVRTLIRASAALAAFTVVAVLPAAGKDLSPKLYRGKGKKADKHWRSGEIRKAISLYDEILDVTSGHVVAERGDALYALLVVSLLPDPADHDPERAKALLDEYLQSFSSHRRQSEVAVLHHLLEARSAEAEKAAALRESENARAQALESERQKLRQASDEHEIEMESLRRQLAEAEEKLTVVSGALKSAKEELAKKDEALEKLTRRVVGRAGDG